MVRPAGGYWLAHDLEGGVAFFDLGTGEVSRLRADGTWYALPDRFPAREARPAVALRGENVGTPSETWYFTDAIGGFFFLPDGPVLLGSAAMGVRARGSILFGVRDGKLETAKEDCMRTALVLVVSDSAGFAAATSETTRTSTTGQRTILMSQLLVGGFSRGR